jgi:hypothetical protein
MFGRKKAEESKQAAHRAAEERTAKRMKFREQQLAREVSDEKAARMSPTEKTRKQANSSSERRKGTPSV